MNDIQIIGEYEYTQIPVTDTEEGRWGDRLSNFCQGNILTFGQILNFSRTTYCLKNSKTTKKLPFVDFILFEGHNVFILERRYFLRGVHIAVRAQSI